MTRNADPAPIAAFGDEWSRHRQDDLGPAELERMWQVYFHIVPWDTLPTDAVGFDMGVAAYLWNGVDFGGRPIHTGRNPIRAAQNAN